MTNDPESRLGRIEALIKEVLLELQQQSGDLRPDADNLPLLINQKKAQIAVLKERIEVLQAELKQMQLENQHILDHLLLGQQIDEQ